MCRYKRQLKLPMERSPAKFFHLLLRFWNLLVGSVDIVDSMSRFWQVKIFIIFFMTICHTEFSWSNNKKLCIEFRGRQKWQLTFFQQNYYHNEKFNENWSLQFCHLWREVEKSDVAQIILEITVIRKSTSIHKVINY